MIAPETIAQTLVPWLGSDFLNQQEGLCAEAAWLMHTWQPQKDSLQRLAAQLNDLLFLGVRDFTKGRLALLMDNGQLIKLRLDDFTRMADELLFLLLDTLAVIPYHQAVIREYAMRSGSLSALRALYLKYRGLQTPEETDTLRRVITSCHEPWRYRQWLDSKQ